MRRCQLGVQQQKVKPWVTRPSPCRRTEDKDWARWGLHEHLRKRNQTWSRWYLNQLLLKQTLSQPTTFLQQRRGSHLGQESYTRLTSVVLDVVNSHVGGNKGSFAVFLFVLLLCQQLGLGLFSWDDVFYFCARRKTNFKRYSFLFKEGSRLRSAKGLDFGDSDSTAMVFGVVFEREGTATETGALFPRQQTDRGCIIQPHHWSAN